MRTSTWCVVVFTLKTNHATGARDVIDVSIVGSLHHRVTEEEAIFLLTFEGFPHENSRKTL